MGWDCRVTRDFFQMGHIAAIGMAMMCNKEEIDDAKEKGNDYISRVLEYKRGDKIQCTTLV